MSPAISYQDPNHTHPRPSLRPSACAASPCQRLPALSGVRYAHIGLGPRLASLGCGQGRFGMDNPPSAALRVGGQRMDKRLRRPSDRYAT